VVIVNTVEGKIMEVVTCFFVFRCHCFTETVDIRTNMELILITPFVGMEFFLILWIMPWFMQ